MLQKLIQAIIAILFSALLIFSIPLINVFLKGNMFAKKEVQTTAIAIKKMDMQEKQKPKPKPARQPERSKPTHRSIKSGPRFAMDLGVASGNQGAAVSMDLVKASSGGSGQSGDVDSKPTARSQPNFQPPASVRESEINSLVTIGFCVDPSGRPYDLKILEESPSGIGLAVAAKDAISKVTFEPAKKDGKPMAFCGLEQPFEIRFKD